MTASSGIVSTPRVATMPKGTGDGSPDRSQMDGSDASVPSFRSALQSCNSRDNTPSVVRDSKSKGTGKGDSEADQKTDKKPEKGQDSGAMTAPVAAPGPEVRVLPLTFSLVFSGAFQETAKQDTTTVVPPVPEATPAAGTPVQSTANAPVSATLDEMNLLVNDDNELPQAPSSNTIEDQPPTPASRPNELAFAAKLSPAPVSPTPQDTPAAPTSAVAARPTVAAAVPARASAPQKYLPGGSLTEEADPQTEKQSQVAQAEPFLKVNATVPSVGPTTEPATPGKSSTSQTSDPAPTQAPHEPVLEQTPASPASSHDFRVRIPDNQGGTMDLRFLESGGEVRVTVRTPDNNLAQTLRSQLNQLTQQLSSGGIQTELWQPGSNRSFSQGSQQESQNFGHGSGGNKREQNQQQESNSNKPRWLEELELSNGRASQ